MIITHDISCARKTADRIIMLKDGEVFKDGLLKDFEDSEDQEITSFFN
jgi:phospholipid/cholesterol/gamma-HCH transport system ATP-binding protein